MVLPPGAPAFAYAEHNIQASYVPPGNWEPSPEALQEAHAMSQVLESEEASIESQLDRCPTDLVCFAARTLKPGMFSVKKLLINCVAGPCSVKAHCSC